MRRTISLPTSHTRVLSLCPTQPAVSPSMAIRDCHNAEFIRQGGRTAEAGTPLQAISRPLPLGIQANRQNLKTRFRRTGQQASEAIFPRTNCCIPVPRVPCLPAPCFYSTRGGLKGNSHQRRTRGFASFWVRERTLGLAGTPGFETNPRFCGNPGV